MFSTLTQSPPCERSAETGSGSRESRDQSRADQLNALWREALTMWLCWSEGHEQLTSQMFEAREDSRQLADLLDQMEQLRWRAMEMTRELLDCPLMAVESHARNSDQREPLEAEQAPGSLFES